MKNGLAQRFFFCEWVQVRCVRNMYMRMHTWVLVYVAIHSPANCVPIPFITMYMQPIKAGKKTASY